ncbi:MAG: DJ-1/PfpI family protein [Pseudomonadota bacterium]
MKSLAVFIFPEVQTLDLFGPLEMLGALQLEKKLAITMVAETAEPVVTRHGQRVIPDKTIQDGSDYDMLLVPGGDSAIPAAGRTGVGDWIVATCDKAELVMSVCTGSILLAMVGVLDGHRATTNKIDFKDTIHLGPRVDWVAQARWVQDGKFFTASGVAAGIDMSLAVVEHLCDREKAEWLADGCEYDWHKDPDWDPFAVTSGLVKG